MTRIVHFSDHHGQIPNLPEADLYICTGDILPNSRLCLWPNKEPEMQMQNDWIEVNKDRWAAAFASPESPLVIVRGNHDFVGLKPLFALHKGPVYEFNNPDFIEVLGYRIGGFRGVPPINGIWSDEISENEIDYKIKQLEKLDILLTHGPGFALLDEGSHYGSKAIMDYVKNTKNDLKLHCFGHCHLDGGRTLDDGHCFFSNAATTINVIDLK